MERVEGVDHSIEIVDTKKIWNTKYDMRGLQKDGGMNALLILWELVRGWHLKSEALIST